MNWNQLLAILWLRWRLTRNQWSRGGTISAVIAIIIFVIGCLAGAASSLVGLLVGAFAMKSVSPFTMLLIWDFIIAAFLFMWLMGIVAEIQRSETIDIGRLLHLPVSLRDIFIVNYLASHVSFVLIIFLSAMVGLSMGLAVGRNWSMMLLVPLVVGFVFMITAWTYCLRGWLVRLMTNKRRRRTIIAVITITFALLGQLPNLYINVLHGPMLDKSRADGHVMTTSQMHKEMLLTAHKIVPFLWLPNGAMSLAEDNCGPALLAAAGTFLIGALGLIRAYRATIRFYGGQSTAKSVVRKEEKKQAAAAAKNLAAGGIPFVPEEASALARIFFCCLKRAPEIKMSLFSNVIILMIFGGMFFLRQSSSVGEIAKPFIAAGAVAVIFFGMTQLFFNQFGYDRTGFRTLVLLPVPRNYILLAKNLALMPFAVGIGLIFLVFVKFVLAVGMAIIFAAVLQSVAAFLLVSMAGNFFSVIAPYRIAAGSLKPTKVSGLITAMIFISHLMFPVLMFPIFLGPLLGLLMSFIGWMPAALVNLLYSAILLTVLALVYRLSLRNFGNLLERREKEILLVVTREVE